MFTVRQREDLDDVKTNANYINEVLESEKFEINSI